ncbi:MAG: PEP-CTERM sorting domain-containing protein [Nostoc sp.]|uniref:PEP-CTERM sorting domain-containing protein n=1 Tax=Nostoc sp. TaxID=1180 RepID=UPI002FF4F65C
MLNKYLKVVLSSALLISLITSFSEKAKAQVLVNDTYTDGGRTNGVDPLDISWFGISSNFDQTVSTPSQIQLGVVDDPILGTGNALNLGTPSFVTFNSSFLPAHFAIGTFAPVSLGNNIGDALDLSFDFRFTTEPSLSTTSAEFPQIRGSGLRFGLYNSGDTPITTDILASLVGSGTPIEDDGGYLVLSGLAGTSSLGVNKENFGSGDSITGGNGNVQLASTTSVPTINDTAPHTANLVLERLSPQLVRLTASVDGFSIETSDSGSGIISSFNEIAVRSVFSNLNVNIDNVVLQTLTSTSVPEPSTNIAIFGLGLGWLLKRKLNRFIK